MDRTTVIVTALSLLCTHIIVKSHRYNLAEVRRPQITRESLAKVEIPSPPLPEQKKIASILTSVDEVIEKTESQIAKLQDLKTGMMQELLTKGIGPGGVPHTEFKDSPVGRIPVGWEVIPDCTSLQSC